MKTLVAYFSRKGYCARVAKDYAKQENAELLEIKTSEPTKGKLNFWWCGRFAMHRWEMKLSAPQTPPEGSDRLIVVSPIWVFSVCAPMRAFLHLMNGQVKTAKYCLVHFSCFPMRYGKTVAEMDRLLGIKAESYESVCCMLGKMFKRRTFTR